MASGEDDVVTRRDYRREDSQGRIIRVKIMEVPRSEKFPDRVKYRMHYGTKDGDTLLRYDNSHGVHERHTPTETEKIDFPGIATLYRMFRAEIDDQAETHNKSP